MSATQPASSGASGSSASTAPPSSAAPLRAESPERVPTVVFRRPREVAVTAARSIEALIRARRKSGSMVVLGLATGSTPMGVYEELVRMHRDEKLSFANVITFNLDEYWPMRRDALQSYHRFMHEHLFDHVDIDPRNIHIPDGSIDQSQLGAACERYERRIDEVGGIDLQLLGIGRTGHVGFNEPGSGPESRTRLITLDRVTRKDAASDFFGEENVPLRAITMGVGTILRARQLLLLAFGEGKAAILRRAIEEPVSESVPASFLQRHANACFLLDAAAAAELTRSRAPWCAGAVKWDESLTRSAVIWLAGRVKKPILKLTAEDYNEHQLQDLLATRGRAYDLNLQVFRSLQETITGWPGGKPQDRKRAGDIDRPRDRLFPKRVLIFSPHPDDDVISMGGTLIRLVDQGHEVHVAYQTSGNLAVFDADALRFADFAAGFNRQFSLDAARTESIEKEIAGELRAKSPGEIDAPAVRELKALIRRGEARAAGRVCGLTDDRLHFLNLPFYETGRVRKQPLSGADIEIVVKLLEKIQPHQVYAAGDLSDPHGTHRTCLAAVTRAWERVRTQAWAKECEVWLYRGAWQEWEPNAIDMAVPLSPEELGRKRHAIFKHQSQKDRPLFPGVDDREFWQRAEDRNRATARAYDALGLAEYEAIEAFVKWDGGSPE